MTRNEQHMTWDDERTKTLIQLDSEGLAFSDIGKVLGLSKNACIGKARRLGLPRRKGEQPARPRTKRTPPNNNKPRLRIIPGALFLIEKPAVDPSPSRDLSPDMIPVAQRVTFSKLKDHHCRFPYGDPRSPDFFFCGGKKYRGSYCAYHAQISYNKPPRLSYVESERLRQLRITAARLSSEQQRAVG